MTSSRKDTMRKCFRKCKTHRHSWKTPIYRMHAIRRVMNWCKEVLKVRLHSMYPHQMIKIVNISNWKMDGRLIIKNGSLKLHNLMSITTQTKISLRLMQSFIKQTLRTFPCPSFRCTSNQTVMVWPCKTLPQVLIIPQNFLILAHIFWGV